MALVPLGNCGSLLDRGIAALLINSGVGVWKRQKTGDCVVVPADGLEIKSYPICTIVSHRSEHDPVPSGIEKWDTSIAFKFSASGTLQSTNPYAFRVARDLIIGTALAALLQSNDEATFDYTASLITAAGRALAEDPDPQIAANNQDMLQFTALHLAYLGTTARGQSDEEGCDWVEVRGFRISACPTAIDMS